MKLLATVACAAVSVAVLGVASTASGSPVATAAAKAATGQVVVVQALPDAAVTVSIDDKGVAEGAEVGDTLGPFDLAAGDHEVRFKDASGQVAMTSTVTVAAGSSSDVVLHRPAAVDGDPVVNVYATPLDPIGPGKSRILVAHTATVAPADVRVDGTTIFTNIANGEFAEADVPSGSHSVSLLPTGQKTDPILGPLDVSLAPRTVTMVYAVGSPEAQSMDAITHVETIAADGSLAPDTIDTGSAGLAAGIPVDVFGPTP